MCEKAISENVKVIKTSTSCCLLCGYGNHVYSTLPEAHQWVLSFYHSLQP